MIDDLKEIGVGMAKIALTGTIMGGFFGLVVLVYRAITG